MSEQRKIHNKKQRARESKCESDRDNGNINATKKKKMHKLSCKTECERIRKS
jgi:hypothetical protein